jgi:hypothetical protein
VIIAERHGIGSVKPATTAAAAAAATTGDTAARVVSSV